MSGKTKTYRKECAYCKNEYVAKSERSKTCSPKCRKALSRARNVDSVTNRDSVTVTPENDPFIRAVGHTVETAIQEHPTVRIDEESAKIVARAVADAISPLVQEFIRMVNAPRETVTVSKSVSVPMPNTPLDLDKDDGYQPMTAAQREAEMANESGGIVVTDSKKKAGTGQNFLNSFMALNS